MDFISVIIPAFNAERWIEKTLQSVSTAIDSECEVIIVNDGSTDNTHDIASRFCDADPRFTLIDIKHVGPCAARRAGFLESQGDYVVFVDSDDYLPVTAISDQRALLDTGGALDSTDERTTQGRPSIVIANTLVRTGPEQQQLLINGQTRGLTGMEYAVEILNRTLPGFLPGHFIARDILEAVEWDDSPEITHQDNFYLLFSLAMKLDKDNPERRCVLVAPNAICYHYLRRAGSQSALMALTPRGLERVWHHINHLGLPEPDLTLWGLEMLNKVFIERGIPFQTSYSVAADLRHRGLALGSSLPEKYVPVVSALGSMKRRNAIANRMARTAGLTSIRPHLTVVVVCRHNVAKVNRTVSSLFGMGFRNLEAIIVDMNSTPSERIALNEMTIRFARVRIVRFEDEYDIKDIHRAAYDGLKAAKGLCICYVRAGDLCCSTGLYDAVTRIDYGADAVLPNYRYFMPCTRLRGHVKTYAWMRSTDESRNADCTAADATEDVYPRILNLFAESEVERQIPFLYGMVWRTDFLKENAPRPESLPYKTPESISTGYIKSMIDKKMRIVTQDKTTGPAFELVREPLHSRLLKFFHKP